MYSSSHSNLLYFYLYITLHFWVMLSLWLDAIRKLLMALPPLNWACIPTLLQMLYTFAVTLGIRNHHVDVAVALVSVVGAVVVAFGPWFGPVYCLFWRLFLVLSLLRAHMGYLPLGKTFLICSFSLRSSWGTTNYPCPMCGGVEHTICSWQIVVGFLETLVSNVLSGPGETKCPEKEWNPGDLHCPGWTVPAHNTYLERRNRCF